MTYPSEGYERIRALEITRGQLYSSAEVKPVVDVSGREPVSWETPLPVALYAMSWRHGPPDPAPAGFEVRESNGIYSVTRSQGDWGKPFETTDQELAVMVCDRWAEEFKALP